MESKFIIAICIIALYVVILLIVGLMSYLYSIKHKPYKTVNDDYRNEIKEFEKFKDELLNNLKPIKTKFELSDDEKILFIDELNISFNENVNKRNSKKEFDDEYDQFYKTLKKNYSLFKFKGKDNEYEKALVYLSNKRIVFDVNSQYKIVKIENILINESLVITLEKEFYKGVYLKTRSEEIKILTDDLKFNAIISRFRTENY
ncbi:hypothetical protein CK556_01970 [Mesoplasma chauliocola]|uniref:Uncharacterized protein n=1 Tax=Mesoplasma chauliocola TaxID=216427 RepID=A0A249SND5_9MOLU|nr:hypothetical protein [Mesoplasma chauliocola]ASZ09122.1 hypothetical protein CK556_01970 [Mesoplasma chauliocola]